MPNSLANTNKGIRIATPPQQAMPTQTAFPCWADWGWPAATQKRQVSNVDETANKSPKTSDNEGAGEINKGEKKPPKGKANRKLSKCLGGQRVSTPHLTKTELELQASGISVAPPERTRSAAIAHLAPPQAFVSARKRRSDVVMETNEGSNEVSTDSSPEQAHSHDKHDEEQDDEEHNDKDNNKYNEQDNAQDNVQDNVQDNKQDNTQDNKDNMQDNMQDNEQDNVQDNAQDNEDDDEHKDEDNNKDDDEDANTCPLPLLSGPGAVSSAVATTPTSLHTTPTFLRPTLPLLSVPGAASSAVTINHCLCCYKTPTRGNWTRL
ncbi:hypothetical protein BYT27DRAFT_7252146 [Phlegmacium glaucopus]|nr:hypothetical protein BYT27DRAFT_7252146 [Phlegmacium glaucopus]